MIQNVGRRVGRTRITAHRRRIIANSDIKCRKKGRQKNKHSSQERNNRINSGTKCRKKGRQKKKHSPQEKNNRKQLY